MGLIVALGLGGVVVAGLLTGVAILLVAKLFRARQEWVVVLPTLLGLIAPAMCWALA